MFLLIFLRFRHYTLRKMSVIYIATIFQFWPVGGGGELLANRGEGSWSPLLRDILTLVSEIVEVAGALAVKIKIIVDSSSSLKKGDLMETMYLWHKFKDVVFSVSNLGTLSSQSIAHFLLLKTKVMYFLNSYNLMRWFYGTQRKFSLDFWG